MERKLEVFGNLGYNLFFPASDDAKVRQECLRFYFFLIEIDLLTLGCRLTTTKSATIPIRSQL